MSLVADNPSALDVLFGLVLEDGTTWGERASDFQIADAEAILGADAKMANFLTRARGGSKPLSLDTPIPTSTGWTTMGEIQVGDALFDEYGAPCSVLRIGEVLLGEDCYRVTFDDRSSIVASGDHEWVAENYRARSRRGYRAAQPSHPMRPGTLSALDLAGGLSGIPLVTTRHMAASLTHGPREDLNWSVPIARSFDLPDAELPLPPYILGAWLGDGHSETARITIGEEDRAETSAMFESLGFPLHSPLTKSVTTAITWRFGNGIGERPNGHGPKGYDTTQALRKLGVLCDKHIPSCYLRASEKQRLELLRGLMDTDGHAFPDKSQVQFTSTSQRLADDVMELVVTLGWKVRCSEHRAKIYGKDCGPVYHVTFRPDESPFSLTRKTGRWKSDRGQRSRHTSRMIVAIDPIPSVPVRCITVDSPSHLYLAGRSAVPTHNSTDIAGIALGWLVAEAGQRMHAYVVAVAEEQSLEVMDAAMGFIARTPGLSEYVLAEGTTLFAANGATVHILTSDGSSAFGKGRDTGLIILDEFAQWPETRKYRRLWVAMLTATQKTPGLRLVILTSAGEPGHFSYGVIKEARDGLTKDFWYVSEVAGKIPWVSEASLEMQRPHLTEAEFRRLHYNEWTEDEDRLLTEDDWESAAVLDGSQLPEKGRRYIITADLGVKVDPTVVTVSHAVAHPTNPRAKLIIIDHLERWVPKRNKEIQLATVRERLVELSVQYNHAPIHGDPSQFLSIKQELQMRGLKVKEFKFTGTSVGELGSTLVQAIQNEQVWLPNNPVLRDELLNVRLRESTPGTYRLDHDAKRHDDQAVAIGMAVLIHIGKPAGTAAFRQYMEQAREPGTAKRKAREDRRAERQLSSLERRLGSQDGDTEDRATKALQRRCSHRWRQDADGSAVCVMGCGASKLTASAH